MSRSRYIVHVVIVLYLYNLECEWFLFIAYEMLWWGFFSLFL